MPIVVGSRALDGAFHNFNLGLVLHTRKEGFDFVELAKTAGEGHLLSRGEHLIPKK